MKFSILGRTISLPFNLSSKKEAESIDDAEWPLERMKSTIRQDFAKVGKQEPEITEFFEIFDAIFASTDHEASLKATMMGAHVCMLHWTQDTPEHTANRLQYYREWEADCRAYLTSKTEAPAPAHPSTPALVI